MNRCLNCDDNTKNKKFCSRRCSGKYKEKNNIVVKKCHVCGMEFIPKRKNKKAKYCSYVCSNNRKRTKEELEKIGKKSKEKFIKNPELLNVVAKNGKKAMKYINDNGLAFRMPVGYHTEDHKKYMSELMTGRDVTWNDKIKENHWSTDLEKREETVAKINKSKKSSVACNTEERRYLLANWCKENPDKVGDKKYKRGKYKNKKKNQYEYYASGFELEYMKKFDADDSIVIWTKKHKIIIEYEIDNKKHRYYPDFLVEYKDGNKKLIETKGRVYDENILLEKNKAADKWCKKNNMTYEIIFQRSPNDKR